VPKTGGTTLKRFFQHFYSHCCYELRRPHYGDPYRIVNVHGDTVTDMEQPFVLLTTHHGTSALDSLLPPLVQAIKVVTRRNPLTRIQSVYNGNKQLQRHTFAEFVRLYLQQRLPPRVTPATYHNAPAPDKLIHLLPQTTWLREPHDMEIRLEHIKEDLTAVLERAEADQHDVAWIDTHATNVRQGKIRNPTPITHVEHQRIVDFYRDDFLWGKGSHTRHDRGRSGQA
jgi:hypothetical protein